MEQPQNKLKDRVVRAAEEVLRRDKSVGPVELLQEMLVLYPGHVKDWQKGMEC